MAEEIVRTIEHPLGLKRVIVVRRFDGRFTYRWQERRGRGWGAASIDAGVYDSADTAEAEARQREPWLKTMFH
jgi:hypothetical protein